MTAVVVVGAQWGDEGKGKIVDLVTEQAQLVVRYGGGPNAGHTLVVAGHKIVVRLLPSGILQPNCRCIMAQGMVVDLAVLAGELDELQRRAVAYEGRLFLSDRAHVILPHHLLIDGLREEDAGEAKIGTTKKGIGPAYEDKAARRGIRLGDLRNLELTRLQIEKTLAAWAPTIAALGGTLPTLDESMEPLLTHGPRLVKLLAEGSRLVDESIKRGERVVFEGAQGILLDVDHGTYPFVTSSSAVAGGACTGAGVGPTRIRRVLGITKAYATRVGSGPFPTELFDEAGDNLRTKGGEFGSVTGRPRRTGWLDLPALRYAARVSGIDSWAITKLDVLAGQPEIKLCVAYDVDGERTLEPPDDLARAKPIYETLPGFDQDIGSILRTEALPKAARELVARIEELTGIEADIVSVGPGREQTIVRNDVFR